jgi:hypothetical protein
MIIAMTCVATLFLLAFGALWHQTLLLSRPVDAVSSPQGIARSVEEMALVLPMLAPMLRRLTRL